MPLCIIMWVYLQNRFVLEKEAVVSVFDRGFLYGDGLFETVRAYRGTIFLLPRHLDRLAHAATQLAIPLPPPKKLATLLYDTLHRNNLKDALLRLTITRGPGYGLAPPVCKKPTIVIFVKPFEGYPASRYRRGITCATVSIRLNGLQEQFQGNLKATSFLGSVLAKGEAVEKGVSEPILLATRQGGGAYLAESSTSNLFWVHRGRVYTPDLRTGILAGITRSLVLELARDLAVPVREGFYRKEALFAADEAFLTSTGFELMPVVRVDQKSVGAGRPGPITRQLHRAFRQRVSADCPARGR